MAPFSSIDRPRVLRLFAGPKPYYRSTPNADPEWGAHAYF